MGRYIVRRLLINIPVLFGITVMLFTFVNLAPGDPMLAMLGQRMLANQAIEGSAADLMAQRRALGLDRPLHERYVVWLREVLRGNLGVSFASREPVLNDIKRRLAPTLELTVVSLIVALLVGIPVGIVAALRQGRLFDTVITLYSFTFASIPIFVFALFVSWFFSMHLDWFPSGGWHTLGEPWRLGDNLRHLVLPVFVLSMSQMPGFARWARNSLLDVLRADYITVARSKGLPERTVTVRHAFRNALLPLVTVISLSLPGLFNGSVLIEVIFAWPGLGTQYLEAVGRRDYPLIIAIGLISAVLVLFSNLLADVAYGLVDPRLRYD